MGLSNVVYFVQVSLLLYQWDCLMLFTLLRSLLLYRTTETVSKVVYFFQVSLLLYQYHDLLTQTLDDKEHFHEEERGYTDKVSPSIFYMNLGSGIHKLDSYLEGQKMVLCKEKQVDGLESSRLFGCL